MRPEIIWYGERGIVASLISYVRGSVVASIRQLLRAVFWAGGTGARWIEAIERANVIVEIGLADFGAPDLMLVCRGASGLPRIVFIEAKATPYEVSARPNTPVPGLSRSGMQARGYNSSVNGQLALKYRFATALQCWAEHQDSIVEPQGIYHE